MVFPSFAYLRIGAPLARKVQQPGLGRMFASAPVRKGRSR